MISGELDVAGLAPDRIRLDVILDDEQVFDLQQLGIELETLAVEPEGVDPDYKDNARVLAVLQELSKRYPTLARVVEVNSWLGLPPSHGQRPFYALVISDNVHLEEDEPTVAFNGLHHARELMTVEAVLDITEKLLEGYAKDPGIRRLVDSLELWFLPVINPDGLDHVLTSDAWWRKNRRPNDAKTFGVDLNRNYPFKWGACNGSSASPGSDTYRGPAAASEPEARLLMTLARDRHFALNVSYHSYGNVVLYPPYGCGTAKLPTGATEFMAGVAKTYAGLMTKDDGKGVYDFRNKLYSVDGLDRDWFFNELGTLAFVTEIGSAFQPSYQAMREKILGGLRPGWRYLLELLLGPAFRGHVRDAQTGKPLVADFEVVGFGYQEGELRRSEPRFGRFTIPLPQGVRTVIFRAKGYAEHKAEFTLGDHGLDRDIVLQPLPNP